MKTIAFSRILFACLLLLMVTSCGSIGNPGGNNNQYYDPVRAKYYEGHDGVVVNFDQMPQKLYYYGNAPQSAANDFPVSVEVQNKGSSFTRGAIFLSGYDPNLIQFDEIPIAMSYPGACSLRLDNYALNTAGFFFQCGDDFTLSGHEGGSFNDFDWLDSIMVSGASWFDDSWLENFRINYQHLEAGDRVDFVYDDLSFGMREHGLLLIGILGGLSFQKFLGIDYLLAGDTYEYPGGEIEYTEFNGHIVDWPQGTDDIEQHFLLTSCYMYTTFAAPTVCIDPQPYSENRKVCSPQVTTWSKGQGAPVAVTRITQENTPRTAVFHVEVENKGRGDVFDAGMLEKCSPYYPGGARSSDYDIVWIGEVRINNRLLDCTPKNYFRLQNGHGEFTCTYPVEYAELNSAYQTPMVIELWYGYGETQEKRVSIKRVT